MINKNLQMWILIIGILVISGGLYFVFGVMPSLQSQNVPDVALQRQEYMCAGEAQVEIQQNADALISQFGVTISGADLGYQIGSVDLSSAQLYIEEQCIAAQASYQNISTTAVPDASLYDGLRQEQTAWLNTAKSMQQSEIDQAGACLTSLVIIREYEQTQPENSYSTYARLYARQSMWDFCSFYGGQAISEYMANATPIPTDAP